MAEYDVYLGPNPCDEPCERLGPDYDAQRTMAECRAYIGQLERIADAAGHPWRDRCRLVVTANDHDFGVYYEVVARANGPEDVDAACWFDENLPELWDAAARLELGLPVEDDGDDRRISKRLDALPDPVRQLVLEAFDRVLACVEHGGQVDGPAEDRGGAA